MHRVDYFSAVDTAGRPSRFSARRKGGFVDFPSYLF